MCWWNCFNTVMETWLLGPWAWGSGALGQGLRRPHPADKSERAWALARLGGAVQHTQAHSPAGVGTVALCIPGPGLRAPQPGRGGGRGGGQDEQAQLRPQEGAGNAGMRGQAGGRPPLCRGLRLARGWAAPLPAPPAPALLPLGAGPRPRAAALLGGLSRLRGSRSGPEETRPRRTRPGLWWKQPRSECWGGAGLPNPQTRSPSATWGP